MYVQYAGDGMYAELCLGSPDNMGPTMDFVYDPTAEHHLESFNCKTLLRL